MALLDLRKFYVNGQWVNPETPNDLAVLNPATEQEIAVISMGSGADVNRAVAAAKAAFPAFSQTSKEERIALLRRIRDIYERRYDEFVSVMTAEMGAPRDLSHGAQADVGLGHLDGMIQALEAIKLEDTYLNGDQIFREPIGVCGLITPWNWPVNQVVLKVLPALAAGCTMVLKPSEMTPIDAMLYAEVLEEAGVPAGVFNLVNGEGPVVGAALSRHPDVAMMSFTGSTRGGTAVAKDAADTVKRVALELGGKSPNLVFADADVDKAVAEGALTCFSNTGQSCDAPTRMLVEASVYDRAVEVATETANAQKVGDPTEAGDHIGPLISQPHWDKVQGMIQAAIDEGARLVAGGTGKPDGLNAGYYCKPTVFADVNNQMMIAREEVFGPVLVLIPFKDEAEAIEIGNDSPYGLAAYVQTGNPERARRVARALRAGNVHVNGVGMDYGTPFGGYKMSGQGREGGLFGLEDFLEIKAVSNG